MSTLDWPAVLTRLVRGEDLDDATATSVMTTIMSGAATSVQIAGFLMSLRAKGETAEEIAGLVRGMREHALRVDAGRPVVDTCGTGGDRAGTFNVSTLAAVVTAAAGAPVAKHGNRAASGRCGSADLLEAWGVVIDLPPDGVRACIDEVGIGFCFAPAFHPAMRHAIPARRELGVPTVFNFLGPLTNPAGARHQTIGVSDPAMAEKMAAVLARLDTVHAFVFHGEDGLDELTTTGASTLYEIRAGSVEQRRFDPSDVGIPRATVDQLKGGDVGDNLRVADDVLSGKTGPPRDIVLLGAAAALIAADVAAEWGDALHRAAHAVDSGAAGELVQRWVATSQASAAS